MRHLTFLIFTLFSLPVLAMDEERAKECKNADGAVDPICFHVSISGCTVEGRNYAEDVSCQKVRTQGRPFRPIPSPREPKADDPRLQDSAFMKELAWVTTQVRSCGCACCHDTSLQKDFALWDINKPYIWTDQLTRRGVVILGGQMTSKIFGGYKPDDNNGFDRSTTGAPTTDSARFRAYFDNEVERLGITTDEIAKMRPLDPSFIN